MNAELFMRAQITEKIFDYLFETKEESSDFSEILRSYDISKEDLHDLLWEKFNISGMEVRIASTAVDFLICSCVEGKDLCDTIRKQISEAIVAAGVFHTNIAPDALCTSDFAPPLN